MAHTFPHDRDAARKRGLRRDLLPMLVAYSECKWRDDQIGFRARNCMENAKPSELDEFRGYWGLSAPPKWYRLRGPLWTSEGFQETWAETVCICGVP